MKLILSLAVALCSVAVIASPQTQVQAGGGFGAASRPVVTYKAGETIEGGDLRYRVLRVQGNLKEYVQRYDQRRIRLQPAFESDQLVVVELEVENVGEAAADPATFSFKLVDTEGGVSSIGTLDARLQPSVVGAGMVSNPMKSRAIIAATGKSKFSIVFSIPSSAKAKSLELYTMSQVVSQGMFIDLPGYLVARAAL